VADVRTCPEPNSAKLSVLGVGAMVNVTRVESRWMLSHWQWCGQIVDDQNKSGWVNFFTDGVDGPIPYDMIIEVDEAWVGCSKCHKPIRKSHADETKLGRCVGCEIKLGEKWNGQ